MTEIECVAVAFLVSAIAVSGIHLIDRAFADYEALGYHQAIGMGLAGVLVIVLAGLVFGAGMLRIVHGGV